MKELIITSRPLFWILGPLVYICGTVYGRPPQQFNTLSPVSIAQAFSLCLPFTLFLFGINDYYDMGSDRTNPRKHGKNIFLVLLEGQPMSPDQWQSQKILIRTGAVFPAVASLLTLNIYNIFMAISLITVSYAYSSPPWRFKTRPPMDAVIMGLSFFFLPFAMGFSLGSDIRDIPLEIFLLTISCMGFAAFTTLVDYESDKACKEPTCAVKYGQRATSLVPALLTLPSWLMVSTLMMKLILGLFTALLLANAVFVSQRLVRMTIAVIYIAGIVATGCVWTGANL